MRARILLAVCAAALAAAVPAGAATTVQRTWYRYDLLVEHAPVEGGSGTLLARLTQILLPAGFHVEARGDHLAFGPVSTCRNTGSVRVAVVSSDAPDAAAVVDQQLPASTTSYGSGTRGDAAWKIVKDGTATLRGAYARPALRLADTWVVVRIGTTPHASCHTGGYRESVAYPLADALATVKASAY